MESKSTSGVLRPAAPSSRYYPFAIGSDSDKEDLKKEVVRLGVELSVSVAESMFLLCDDIPTMLFFCYKLWRYFDPDTNPVFETLFRVIHYVYTKDIKPKIGVFQNGVGKSVQWNFVRTTWDDLLSGILLLHRLISVLRKKDSSGLLLWAVANCKQRLKNLEDKLRSAEDISEANGFCRETIKSDIFCFWKSLLDEEAVKETPRGIEKSIVGDMFETLVGEPCDMEKRALPLNPPYIFGRDFAKQELKEEAVRLGVEISVCVAQTMFFLCGDVRSMLWFCFVLWRDAKNHVHHRNSPVVERLLRVIHYVYLSGIKPKNGVYKNIGVFPVPLRVDRASLQNFDAAIVSLNDLVRVLRREGRCLSRREFPSSIRQELKKVEEKLRRVKPVIEANGFRREAIEPSFFGLWKSLFDKEAKEATRTLKVIKRVILLELFLPLQNEVAPTVITELLVV